LRYRWWTYPVVFVLGGIFLTDEHVPSPSDLFQGLSWVAFFGVASLLFVLLFLAIPSLVFDWFAARVRRVWKRRQRGN